MRFSLTIVLSIAVFVVACAKPVVGSPAQAVRETVQGAQTILRQAPTEYGTVVLFTTITTPGIQVCLTKKEKQSWTVDIPVGLQAPKSLGAVTYSRKNLGKTVSPGIERALTHVIYGEVTDPKVRWVEISTRDGSQVIRVDVVDNTFLILTNSTNDVTRFILRAGHDSEILYTGGI